MLSTASITLHPDTTEALLYGGPKEASDTVITGCVLVSARNAAQLASLTVTLRPQRTRMFRAHHSLTPPTRLQAELVAGGQTAPHIVHREIDSRTHEWRFSISIPGSTAETIISKDCIVAYELVASAQIPGSLASTVQSKAHPIAIKRTPPPDSLWSVVASESICETAVWRSKLELSLIAESRIIHDQQALSVRGVIRPLAKGLSMKRAGFQLVERISHCAGIYGLVQPHTAKHIVVDNSIDMPSTEDLSCSTPFSEGAGLPLVHETSAARCLAVPPAYTGIQYDIHRDPIHSAHELVLFLTIVDSSGSTHNLRLATPVFVLPKAAIARRTSLPRYEDAGDDRLVSSGAAIPRRDSDFWSQFVLVDTGNGDAAALHDDADDALDACPLVLDGYRARDDAQPPPPSYPGAASSIERTLVSPKQTTPGQPLDRMQNPLHRLCSRALLRHSKPTPLVRATVRSSSSSSSTSRVSESDTFAIV
ncbi:hypothetical protein GGF46_001362 [Coemansia sp. RSA 552]|nr:hypothetical protein GGF46_001362 [Coemansia sp. RSA 552]